VAGAVGVGSGEQDAAVAAGIQALLVELGRQR
jgi:hypothetical protein